MVEPSRKIWTAAHIRPRIEFREIPLNQWAWKTACVFNRSSLGTEFVGYETKASNETRRMAHAARGCPTRSVPACLRPRDWHADRAIHPRPFGHYRRSRDPSPAPMVMSRMRSFFAPSKVVRQMSCLHAPLGELHGSMVRKLLCRTGSTLSTPLFERPLTDPNTGHKKR